MAAIDPASHTAASTFRSCPSEDVPFIRAIGFTELYNPSTLTPKKDAIVDIIFVHGLKGHPKDTWTHGNELPAPQHPLRKWFRRREAAPQAAASTSSPLTASSNSCFWPFHLLSRDAVISSARLLVYGYDSHPTHFYKSATNQMTITQHAIQLNAGLAQVRSGTQGRPLIFVAHSLGGILVKDALDEAKQDSSEPASADIVASCRAIVFMGTPHLGADAAAWGEVLSNIVGALPGAPSTETRVLRGLQPESELLDRITRNFNRLLDGNKIRICTVQEGRGLTGIQGASSKVCYPLGLIFPAYNGPGGQRQLVCVQSPLHRKKNRQPDRQSHGPL